MTWRYAPNIIKITEKIYWDIDFYLNNNNNKSSTKKRNLFIDVQFARGLNEKIALFGLSNIRLKIIQNKILNIKFLKIYIFIRDVK